MAAAKTITVYVIRSVQWVYNDEWNEREEGAEVPLKTFRVRANAEAFCRQREEEARAGKNPFRFGDGFFWDSFSSLSFDDFRQRLIEAGITAPSQAQNAEEWWEKAQRRLTPAQREMIWDLLDQVRFFEVVAMKVPLET